MRIFLSRVVYRYRLVWMIRYDVDGTYRDTFDPIHDTYRRYVSDQIYDVTRHIFDKLVCSLQCYL